MSVFRGDERMRSDGESGLARDVGVGPRVGRTTENLLTLATGLDRQRAGRSGDMFGGLVTTTTRTRRGGGRAGGRLYRRRGMRFPCPGCAVCQSRRSGRLLAAKHSTPHTNVSINISSLSSTHAACCSDVKLSITPLSLCRSEFLATEYRTVSSVRHHRGYVFISVCLFVSRITQKLLNRFSKNSV